MDTSNTPNRSGKARKSGVLHRFCTAMACLLAILILANLAKLPGSAVDIKDVISRLNDQLDLLVKVRAAYFQIHKLHSNLKKNDSFHQKRDIDLISRTVESGIESSVSDSVPKTRTAKSRLTCQEGCVIVFDNTRIR